MQVKVIIVLHLVVTSNISPQCVSAYVCIYCVFNQIGALKAALAKKLGYQSRVNDAELAVGDGHRNQAPLD